MHHLTPGKVLIVAGMHRSGTSLTSNWLSLCGLHVGSDLTQSKLDNPLGHYEDSDFFSLHRRILRANDLSYLVPRDCDIIINEKHQSEAEELIASKNVRPQWGWKDPRTCLFLEFWKALIPEMKVLAVYRHYTHVADSLLRRDRRRFKYKTKHWRWIGRWRHCPQHTFLNILQVRKNLYAWDRYNWDILAFAEAHPDDILLIRSDDVIAHSARLVAFFNTRWNFNLTLYRIEELYDPDLLKSRLAWPKKLASALLSPDIVQTYQQLEAWRSISLARFQSAEARSNGKAI